MPLVSRSRYAKAGARTVDNRQEADTISRLVCGFASAYKMTGDERYLEAAEKGTAYLREHFRATDGTKDICYWYHTVDVKDGSERKILSSEFGDDSDAMPCHEQIYALAGLVQSYRLTGDRRFSMTPGGRSTCSSATTGTMSVEATSRISIRLRSAAAATPSATTAHVRTGT